MKKLSVIAMVAMTALASTSCISFDEDEIPGTPEEYGYIKLSASADDVMVTRGEVTTVQNVNTWFAYVEDSDNGNAYGELNRRELISGLADKTFKTGQYKIVVSNLASNDWDKENDGFGAPYWEGTKESVDVKAGNNQVTIECGSAKNTMFYIDADGFKGEKLEVKVTAAERNELTFEKGEAERNTIDKKAYFKPETELSISITYTLGNSDNQGQPIRKQLILGDAGTKSKLTISSNDSGKIELTITYIDFEDSDKNESVIIDPFTGEEAAKQS